MSVREPSVGGQFAPHIRAVRTALGMSQRELAEAMTDRGFTTWVQSTVTKTETAERPLRLDEFVAVCRILDIDPAMAILGLREPLDDREAQVAERRAQLRGAERDLEQTRQALEVRQAVVDELAAQLADEEAALAAHRARQAEAAG